ncbi:MAG: helix-turn-helix domain-containing protein [Caldilineaceae bacterium]|nr:helix-turn-helix domain-containing protein [Caldilineaceae bacterium]
MKRSIRIGMALAPADPFWVQVREAARQRAQELGVVLVPVHVPYGSPAADIQLGFLDDLRAQELDALIAHSQTEGQARPILASGIAVVSADDTDVVHPRLVSPASLYDAAILAGRFLVEGMHGRGHMLIVGGLQSNAKTTRTRLQGISDILQSCPEIQHTLIRTWWRYEEAYEQIMDEQDEWLPCFGGRPVDALFGLSDSLALAARDVGRRLGFVDDHTLIAGVNGDPLAIAAIVDGTMHATVDTSPQDLGRNLVEYSVLAAQGCPLPQTFPYSMELVTRENVAQVAARKLVAIAELPSRLVDVNRRQEQQRVVQLQTSLELNRRVGSILEWEELMRELAEIIRSRYEYDHVQFYLWSEEDRCLRLDEPGKAIADRTCLALAESGPLGQALLRNGPIYIPDTHNSQRFSPDPRWPMTHSRVIVPVHVGGRILGILDLHSQHRVLRTQIDLDALQSLGDQLGVAFHNAQMYSAALEAKREAERANHLKTRLLANVSHELRTPLNIILGYSQAVLAMADGYDPLLPAELLSDLQHVEHSGQHLVHLVDDLLSLSQAEIGALEIVPEQVAVGPLLSDVFHSMAGSSTHGEVEWRLQLPTIWVDPVRLRQVLHNLLGNAEKFTARGHITLGAVVEQPWLRIWVEDTGAGMLPELRDRINAALQKWEMVTQDVGRQRTGMGLGLSVVQYIVRLHNGQLHLESQLGHGTICHVRLPLQMAGAPHLAPEPAARIVSGPAASEKIIDNIIANASALSQQIAAYICDNYASSFSRDDIAAALQVSPDYVSRVFRKETGLSPWQFLNRYRIMQAQKLLLSNERTVTEIGCQVGFNDPAYFVRVFHRETGRTPHQYRKGADRKSAI